MTDVVLSARDLAVHFPVHAPGSRRRQVGQVRAVDGVDLDVHRGETLGLVGESGCGKSTLGLALLRLVEPTHGTVRFGDLDLTRAGRRALKDVRRRLAMVFQDPFASLDPRRTVGETVAEPLEVHGLGGDRHGRRRRVAELLEQVGLATELARRHPHELSGGQRQRVGIARALAGDPEVVVCDEPIASLDVSIQAQVLNLLAELQRDLGLTYVFIAHDLAAVQHVSDRVAVMYLGRIVELGATAAVVDDPAHPYTRALLSAVPSPDPATERTRRRIVLHGDVPTAMDPPSGCRFRTRCPEAFEPCPVVDPSLQAVGGERVAACHLHGVVGEPVEPDRVPPAGSPT